MSISLKIEHEDSPYRHSVAVFNVNRTLEQITYDSGWIARISDTTPYSGFLYHRECKLDELEQRIGAPHTTSVTDNRRINQYRTPMGDLTVYMQNHDKFAPIHIGRSEANTGEALVCLGIGLATVMGSITGAHVGDKPALYGTIGGYAALGVAVYLLKQTKILHRMRERAVKTYVKNPDYAMNRLTRAFHKWVRNPKSHDRFVYDWNCADELFMSTYALKGLSVEMRYPDSNHVRNVFDYLMGHRREMPVLPQPGAIMLPVQALTA